LLHPHTWLPSCPPHFSAYHTTSPSCSHIWKWQKWLFKGPDLEDAGDIFLWNVSWLLLLYSALYPRR
jgi:hypothetical protein